MASNALQWLVRAITSFISYSGYPGILVLMGIGSACIPIPSEVIMLFSGYLVVSGRFTLSLVTLVGAVGCNAGSMVAYGIGALGGRPLAEKYGRWVWISKADLDRAERWFDRFGDWAVFFGRMVPVVRAFIAVPAGIGRMKIVRFNVFTFLGSLPWCWALAYAGVKLGDHWNALGPYFQRVDSVLAVVLVLGAVLFVYRHWKHRLRSEEAGEA
jgi:membrane protein DedA with SNARE-associated domain